MENGKQIAKRLQEVLLDGKWIANTNYNEQISSLNWQQASQQIGSLNTIAALTFHINYYLEGILNVFAGGDLEIRDKFSFDAPPITSQEDWERLRTSFITNAEKFVQEVAQMTDATLNSHFVKVAYGDYRRNIEGVIEHSYYHLGQIAIIKKMILLEG